MTPTTSALLTDPRPIETIGDAFANVWQLGYVTNDLERGLELLAERFGVTHALEAPTDGFVVRNADDEVVPWQTRIAMAAKGGLILELIEPLGGEVGYYTDALPADGSFAVAFHHVAVTVAPGDEQWSRLRDVVDAAGLRFDTWATMAGRVRLAYVDMRAELGHWLEFCQLEREDVEFFSGLIADSA
ncbi:MAG TPA: VOC family protein [Solirubrobacteraceae bacterium]|jgi:hypothetical protein|nr:VOC family protein [Solirubrobacteraceae bacterium]